MTKKEDMELQREIVFMRELQHENIIALHDVFSETEICGFVMDLATGGDVFDRLMNRTSYSELDARTSILSLLSAIHHCHERRIAHRDIKPENLLIVQDIFQNKEIVKLADFGFATKAKNESCLVTQCGSPLYVSPEILHGTPYGTKTDLWSIGIMSYILLCGYPPFVGENSKDLFRVIKRGKFTFSERYWESITSEAKQFISSLLVSDPKERHDTSQALRHPWMTMESDTFTDLATSLQKLKLFNAKRKLRQAVFSLIATNKLTSLGLRFNSANAEDNNGEDAASRPRAVSNLTMETSPTNSSSSLQTEQSLEDFPYGTIETMHTSPKHSGSTSQNEHSTGETPGDNETVHTPANSSSSSHLDQGLEVHQLEQFIDHPPSHIDEVNDDSKDENKGQNRTKAIRSKIAHLINGVKGSRKIENIATLTETTSHLKQTGISNLIEEVKVRSTSGQEDKMIQPVTKDNIGDEESKTAAKKFVASQTSLHVGHPHADNRLFQNEKGKKISKVIEHTETRSRQNYYEYFGGRR
jgi:serine/threonine protein kinase